MLTWVFNGATNIYITYLLFSLELPFTLFWPSCKVNNLFIQWKILHTIDYTESVSGILNPLLKFNECIFYPIMQF